MDRPLRVISLGAGVQSTTMLLMALRGEFGDMPDCAIFADVGAEPKAVYDHLAWLTAEVAPFPVHVVSHGNLRDDTLASATTGSRVSNPPFHSESGILFRNCTRDYKVRPLDRKTIALLKKSNSSYAEKWLGISLDEPQRMRESNDPRFVFRYPLIYDKPMTRLDCLDWMAANNYPKPPRSACTFCPYHSDAEWRNLRDNQPDDWADAVAFDNAIRNGISGTKEKLFVHKSKVPLDEADLSTAEDRGQIRLWGNECEGMCGV